MKNKIRGLVKMNAVEVAKAIVNKAQEKNQYINITKLQKLLYIVYGLSAAGRDTPPFDENPLCLPYGPVFGSVYQSYKNGELNLQSVNSESKSVNDEYLKSIIDIVVDHYGKYGAQTLSEWTHREGSAWSVTDSETFKWGVQIPVEYIKKEFNEILRPK